MKCIINGKVITPYKVYTGKAIIFDTKIVDIVDEEKIDKSAYEIIDAKGRYVAPGLVDIHIHGYLGDDASDGNEEGLKKMAREIVKNGVTSWLPTTMTVSKDELDKAFNVARKLKDECKNNKLEFAGAEVLGVHAEGPFINPKKKGAQLEECIIAPDLDFILKYKDIIKLITVAPEMDENFEFIKALKEKTDILISIGHTCATFDETMDSILAGVGHATHLFNAMTALAHRDPGVVGAALTTNISVELIADTFHINPALFKLVADLKKDKLVLITDCIRAGGLEDGVYDLGGQAVTVKGIQCKLADGTIAGSVLKLNKAVKNVKEATDLPLYEIVNMASLNPAKAIKVDDRKGSLEVGKDADIIILDEQFNVVNTIVGGDTYYTA